MEGLTASQTHSYSGKERLQAGGWDSKISGSSNSSGWEFILMCLLSI